MSLTDVPWALRGDEVIVRDGSRAVRLCRWPFEALSQQRYSSWSASKRYHQKCLLMCVLEKTSPYSGFGIWRPSLVCNFSGHDLIALLSQKSTPVARCWHLGLVMWVRVCIRIVYVQINFSILSYLWQTWLRTAAVTIELKGSPGVTRVGKTIIFNLSGK